MKALRLSLLSALVGSTAAMGAAVPVEMAGSYQALVSSTGETPSPAGLVAFTVTTKGTVSGKLTTDAKKVYSFKTTLDYTAGDDAGTEVTETGVATHTLIEISQGKDLPVLTLNLKLRDFAGDDTVDAALKVGETTLGVTDGGFKVKTYAKGETVPTLGSYTVAFELAEDVAGAPEGSGYAVAKMDAKGILKLTGATGDGIKFTASLPNGPANQFVIFANPYKRDGCFLAGHIRLSARTGGGFHMTPPTVIEDGDFDLQWKKTGTDKDKSYRAGFGPLDLLASVEPWSPAAKQAVADYFDLGANDVFEVALTSDLGSAFTPTSLSLTAKNVLEVTSGGLNSPSVLIGNGWAKILKGKVDPKTGKLTATLSLENEVAGKTVKRKVVIEGVMMKLVAEDNSALFQGFTLVPSLTKGGPLTSGMIAFPEIIVNPNIAAAAATAGTYTGSYSIQLSTIAGTPAGKPTQGQNVSLTVSPDLKTLEFNGRLLSLSGDSRPVALVYQDLSGGLKLVVTIRLNFEGVVTSYEGIYTSGRTTEIFTSGPTTKSL